MRQKGFSIVEILVVLAILAILLAIGYRGLLAYLEAQRMREAVENVKNTLFETRNRAALESQAYRLKVCGNDRLGLAKDGGGDPCASAGNPLPYGIQLGMFDGLCTTAKTELRFTGRGLPVESRCFVLSYRTRSRKVAVLATGKVVTP